MRLRHTVWVAAVLAACMHATAHEARADWSTASDSNNAACIAAGDQMNVTVTSDGAGGLFLAWQDYRQGAPNYDIYAQHMESNGNNVWDISGVAVCTAAGEQQYPVMVPAGSGDAIAAWIDKRFGANFDVYAQRMNGAGSMQWTANGVPLSNSGGDQTNLAIVPDGSGGAVVVWQDTRFTINEDIFAQRIDAGGNVRWAAGGQVVVHVADKQSLPRAIPTGDGGAIVTWQDNRAGGASYDIYAQRLEPDSGLAMWTANGTPVCDAPGNQTWPQIVSDGSGGAIIAWEDRRNGVDYDIYAQRLDGSGNALWDSNGVVVSAAANSQGTPVSVEDGAGGIVIGWYDGRSGTHDDLYAQRLDGSGTPAWTVDGVPLSTSTNTKNNLAIATDDAAGAVLSWDELRAGTSYDILAQRVDGSGTLPWGASPIPVSSAPLQQQFPAILAAGGGDVIVAWRDRRNGTGYDIYAQKIGSDGSLGGTPTAVSEDDPHRPDAFRLYPAFPNPFNPSTMLRFDIGIASHVRLDVFDPLGRLVATLVDESLAPGAYEVPFDGLGLASGVYFYRLQSAAFNQTGKALLLK